MVKVDKGNKLDKVDKGNKLDKVVEQGQWGLFTRLSLKHEM